MNNFRKTVEDIRKMFSARSVAVVGASSDPRKFGFMTLNSILDGGYDGKVYPINPKGGEILGIKVYPSISDIPGSLDLAVIIVPAKFVPSVLTEAADKGISGAVILSGGFREAGRPDLESKITAIAKERGIRLMGPNIQGVNYLPNKLCAMFFPVIKTKGPLGIVSQSGTFTAALSEWADDEGFGISAAVNLGNQADLCESDYIDFFAEDENTKAVVMYLEGVKDGRRFLETIQRTAPDKPIAILKAGRTASGQKSAASHTGSLAGKHEVFAAACRQSGVFCASDLEHLYDGAKALSTVYPLKGNRVLAISTSGGIGVLASDEVDLGGLVFPPLSQELLEELKSAGMPPLAVLSNPLDMVSIDAAYFEKAVLAADGLDFADIFLLGFGDPVAGGVETVKRLASKIKGQIAVVYLGGGDEEKKGRVEIQASGVPVFPCPERAMRGLAAACEASAFAKAYPRKEKAGKVPVPARHEGEAGDKPTRFVLETDAVKYLEQAGIPYPAHGLAANAAEAVKLAEEIGYPVVLKIVSPDVVHKSDAGGVRVGLHTPDQVSKAYDDMVNRVQTQMPDSEIAGVLVCKQAEEGLEIIVGALRDPVFGPTVMFGMGGVYTEVYKDVTFRIAPLGRVDAEDMIKEIQGYPILAGARGHAGYDVDKVVKLLVSVSDLVTKHPGIQELDLNPVRVYEHGILTLDIRLMKS